MKARETSVELPSQSRGAQARGRERTCVNPLSSFLSLAGWSARRAARCASGPTMFFGRTVHGEVGGGEERLQGRASARLAYEEIQSGRPLIPICIHTRIGCAASWTPKIAKTLAWCWARNHAQTHVDPPSSTICARWYCWAVDNNMRVALLSLCYSDREGWSASDAWQGPGHLRNCFDRASSRGRQDHPTPLGDGRSGCSVDEYEGTYGWASDPRDNFGTLALGAPEVAAGPAASADTTTPTMLAALPGVSGDDELERGATGGAAAAGAEAVAGAGGGTKGGGVSSPRC